MNSSKQQITSSKVENSVDDEIVRELNEEVAGLAKTLEELKDIHQATGEMIHSQGVKLKEAEVNTSISQVKTQEGVSNIAKAAVIDSEKYALKGTAIGATVGSVVGGIFGIIAGPIGAAVGGGGGGLTGAAIGYQIGHKIGDFKKSQVDKVIFEHNLKIKWVVDSTISRCQKCAISFTTTNRKHHCRACGKIFCNLCSSKKTSIQIS